MVKNNFISLNILAIAIIKTQLIECGYSNHVFSIQAGLTHRDIFLAESVMNVLVLCYYSIIPYTISDIISILFNAKKFFETGSQYEV